MRRHKQLWEDFEDTLVARARRKEKSVSLEEVKISLLKRHRLAE
jgi:hypothetical protein